MALRLSLSFILKKKKRKNTIFSTTKTHTGALILNLLTLIRQMQQASALCNGLVLEEKGYEPSIYNVYKFS